jgi:two-component system copper resistance phosphate regulon response regulator CusR
MMRILSVDDERTTAAYLRQGLAEHGFGVATAAEGDDGLHLARTGRYALLILDVMLPARDGWSVLAALRQSGTDTPVLFLSARDAIDDRVKGLTWGPRLGVLALTRRLKASSCRWPGRTAHGVMTVL